MYAIFPPKPLLFQYCSQTTACLRFIKHLFHWLDTDLSQAAFHFTACFCRDTDIRHQRQDSAFFPAGLTSRFTGRRLNDTALLYRILH